MKRVHSPDAKAQFEELLRRSHTAPRYALRLYVTGTTERSRRAIANLRALCDEYLPGRHDVEVVDIYQQPTAAMTDQIIAAPTLVKVSPPPTCRTIGDLSNRDKVIASLSLGSSDDLTEDSRK